MLLEQPKVALKKRQERRPPAGTVASRIWDMRGTDERPADFARRLGISQQALDQMARGKGGVTSEVLAKIVQHTKADPVYLLTGRRMRTKSPERELLERIAIAIERMGIQVSRPAKPTQLDPGAVDAHSQLLAQPAQPDRQDRESDTPERRPRKRGRPG